MCLSWCVCIVCVYVSYVRYACVCTICVCMYDMRVYVRYACVCTVCVCMYGMRVYVRYACVCTVCVCVRYACVWTYACVRTICVCVYGMRMYGMRAYVYQNTTKIRQKSGKTPCFDTNFDNVKNTFLTKKIVTTNILRTTSMSAYATQRDLSFDMTYRPIKQISLTIQTKNSKNRGVR